MKETLRVVRIKDGCLEQYRLFATQITEQPEECIAMFKRYDIESAKMWLTNISGKAHVIIHHCIGSSFAEKMKAWDDSDHPFDVWFRANMAQVYESERPADMELPEKLVDFKL
jgi:hypothetical protein